MTFVFTDLPLPRQAPAAMGNGGLANRDILWGWKRDSGRKQRVIAFGGTLALGEGDRLLLRDWFFFYRNRCSAHDARSLFALLTNPNLAQHIGNSTLRRCARTRLSVVDLCGGPGLGRRRALIERLLNRRPRQRIPQVVFPTPTEAILDVGKLQPLALYVGSGLSYEAGLPTLATIHEVFGVDVLGASDFIVGAADPVPQQLAADCVGTFARFVDFHIRAALVQPSTSHTRLAMWHKSGLITRILTDNVDNLFAKLGVPYQQTRGVGLFNDPFPVLFDRKERTLLVIGVAADRRSIIKQARTQGLKLVVVNPELQVSPRSQSLSYLRSDDLWYRMTAEDFFAAHTSA